MLGGWKGKEPTVGARYQPLDADHFSADRFLDQLNAVLVVEVMACNEIFVAGGGGGGGCWKGEEPTVRARYQP